jgi:hypothetical protein
MAATITPGLLTFENANNDGGGWVTEVAMHPLTGRMLARCDVCPPYVRDLTDTAWRKIIDNNSMPSPFNVHGEFAGGAYGIAMAKTTSLPAPQSAHDIFYMNYRKRVLKTLNGGQSWNFAGILSFSHPEDVNGNSFRVGNRYIAVDPKNHNHVIASGPFDGAFRSTDGGDTWTPISGLPADPNANPLDSLKCGVYNVLFDESVAAVSGNSGTIWAVCGGNGMYRSTDGGANWVKPAGGPVLSASIRVSATAIGSNGVVWAAIVANEGDGPGTAGGTVVGKLFKWSSGAWSEITSGFPSTNNCISYGIRDISVDPTNNSRVVLTAVSGQLQSTIDGGSNWSAFQVSAAQIIAASDIPYLVSESGEYLAVGSCAFHPTIANTLVMANGVGVFYTDIGAGNVPTVSTWSSQSLGIRELVSQRIWIADDGQVCEAMQDRMFFSRITWKKAPSQYFGNTPVPNTKPLRYGTSIKVLPTNRNFGLVAGWNESGGSQAGGYIKTTDGFKTNAVLTPNVTFSNSYTGITSVTLTNAGSGGTPGTYAVTFVGGNSAFQSVTFTVNGAGSISAVNWIYAGECTIPPTCNFSTCPGLVNAAGTVNLGTIATTLPNKFGGGELHPFTEQHWIWAATQDYQWVRTTDGGANWTDLVLPGITGKVRNGGRYASLSIERMCTDAVVPGLGWLYHPVGGLYEVNTSANSITQLRGVFPDSPFFNVKLKSCPKRSKHIYYSNGPVDGTTSGAFYRTRNGTDWTEVADVLEVNDFAFGANPYTDEYPSMVISGYLVTGAGTTEYGIFESYDDCQTWIRRCTGLPLGTPDKVKSIAAHPTRPEFIMMGFHGMSTVIGKNRPGTVSYNTKVAA